MGDDTTADRLDLVRLVAEETKKVACETVKRTNGRMGIAPLAIIVAPGRLLPTAILDIRERKSALRGLIQEHGGEAFVLMYSGTLRAAPSAPGVSALFIVWLDISGEGSAVAIPYRVDLLKGVVFDPPELTQPLVAQGYKDVFPSGGGKVVLT